MFDSPTNLGYRIFISRQPRKMQAMKLQGQLRTDDLFFIQIIGFYVHLDKNHCIFIQIYIFFVDLDKNFIAA